MPRLIAITLTLILAASGALFGALTAATAAAPSDHVAIGTASYHLTGLNVRRGTDDLVAYTSGRAPTNRWGTEAAVKDGVVTKVQTYVGRMSVPKGGVVLSGHGAARVWLTRYAKLGVRVDQIPGFTLPTTTTTTTTTTTPTSPTPTPTPPPPATGTTAASGTYAAKVLAMPGLTHYYPLTAGANDMKGSVNGSVVGATFGAGGATFDGNDYIQLPDNDDFSVTSTGQLTVVAFVSISNWQANRQGGEYVHYMGKGVSGAHEWTFRYYPDNHSSRPSRLSFYHYNTSGGLGAGSYSQEGLGSTEFMITGQVDLSNTRIYRDGVLRDTDALSGYGIRPTNTSSPVRIGTRDMSSGFLVGKVRRVAFFNRSLSATDLAGLWAARTMAN